MKTKVDKSNYFEVGLTVERPNVINFVMFQIKQLKI